MFPKDSVSFLADYLRNWQTGADHLEALGHIYQVLKWGRGLFGGSDAAGDAPVFASDADLADAMDGLAQSPPDAVQFPAWLAPILLDLAFKLIERLRNKP